MKKITIVFLSLLFLGTILGATPVYAAPCGFITPDVLSWGTGRIESMSIRIVNFDGCPNGWGETQGSVLLNDVPANITHWEHGMASVSVPSAIEGLANIKVVGSDEVIYGTSQLLISIKVNSYPSQITLGDSIEITGEGFNNSEAGKVVDTSVSGYNSPLSVISWTDSKIVISTSNFGSFKVGSNTFKIYYGSSNLNNGYQSKTFDINISAPPCTTNSWSCSDWNTCSSDGTQIRTCEKMGWGNPLNYCEGGTPSPAISQSCMPVCTNDNWSCGDWGACLQGGTKTRVCNKTGSCQGGVSAPTTTQSCTYIPACLSFNYSSWTVCGSDGTQTRNIISKYPSNCEGGELPKTTQSCTYTPTCTTDSWSCGDWGACSTSNSQIRTCNKTANCSGGTPPSTTQSCTYTPPCAADTWTCGDWNSCSPSGVQNRSCRMTFDCPSAVTLPPVTDQYCESPDKSTPQTPPSGDDKISNQDAIIKSTVKLICLFDEQSGMQGSGTIIDASGLILTNKHVVSGTVGCLVEFINNLNDQPNYDARQIADIVKVSSTEDMAVLKLRNPNNQKLNYINITNGNSNIQLGTKINVYGYPAIFGKNITYTSGDFSGIDGSYLKTTAILEHGNSGGGAYLNNGTFIGIPSAVVRGELNALGYILSINKINSWLGNTSNIISDNSDSNNYSRVSSVLDSISLKKLGNLQFLVAGSKSADTQSKTISQIQKNSTIAETNADQKTNIEQNNQNTAQVEAQQQKPSLFKRFINWITHFFK